jgi:predicted transcriptional regulator
MQQHPIQTYILHHIKQHPHDLVAVTMDAFHVTRTTVHRHLQHLIKAGAIIKIGHTKQTVYYLTTDRNKQVRLKMSDAFDEFDIFNQYVARDFSKLPKNVEGVLSYFITEILNNAKDHSLGSEVMMTTAWDKENIIITIADDGIGIFQKLKKAFHLSDIRESPLELSKGKITTDPQNHTGEGLFFSAKAADELTIAANNLVFYVNNIEKDWTLSSKKTPVGTAITFKINQQAKQNLVNIFKRFQNNDTLTFEKTKIHVDLAQLLGEKLISRSQAKRIVRNLEKFSHITLDFKKVDSVGQGFVDEIFRVYQNQNPEKKIVYINANVDVEFMIKRSG